jgi:hypothetical protein
MADSGDDVNGRGNAQEFTGTSKDAVASMGEELDKVISKMTLHDDPLEKELDKPTKLVKAYLFMNEPEFVRVMEFRDRASNPSLFDFHADNLTLNRVGTRTKI